MADPKPEDGYTFEDCTCVKVVDGDTIDVELRKRFDIGFKVEIQGFTMQRLRLLGVDTPELRPRRADPDKGRTFDGLRYYETDEQKALIIQDAKRARAHVIEVCLNKDMKVITYKSDSFGRYLADVYLTIEGGEIHLNQDLLDRGLAQKYER